MQDFPSYPLGFGGAAISGEGKGYGFGQISASDAKDLVLAAYDSGFRVFDTAPIYGFGLSEKRLAAALKSKRESVFYVSKAGVTWDQYQRVDKCNDPKVIDAMFLQSLKDLSTDYIDLYMIHWPDERHDIRRAMEVLARYKDKGHIRYIGLCNTFEEDFLKASEVCPVDAIQDTWNAFSHFETARRYEFLADSKVWKMGYASLDKGILTGRVDANRKFDAYDCRSWAPWWKKQKRQAKYKLVEELKTILNYYEMSLLDFALHFARKDFMNINLVGPRSQSDLQEIVRSSEKKIPATTVNEILSKWQELGYAEEDFDA